MTKRKVLLLVVGILLLGLMVWFLYLPKSVTTVMKRLPGTFVCGQVIATQEIEANTDFVLYANPQADRLYNTLIRSSGPFYRAIELNGSVALVRPTELEEGQLRAQVLISWYDRSDKYVVMVAVYDEEVDHVTYRGEWLQRADFLDFHIYYGYGMGDYMEYELFDKNGMLLRHVK